MDPGVWCTRYGADGADYTARPHPQRPLGLTVHRVQTARGRESPMHKVLFRVPPTVRQDGRLRDGDERRPWGA